MEPHSGRCETCHQPIIDAHAHTGGTIRLDPSPASDGPHAAYVDAAGRWRLVEHPSSVFMGSRRRLHSCPDVQLEL